MTDPTDVVQRARQALDGITENGRGWETREREKNITRVVHSGEWEGSLTRCCDCPVEAGFHSDADAEFVASAPDLVRELADELEQLRRENHVLRTGPHISARAWAEKEADRHAEAADKAEAERDELRATIDRVRMLHSKRPVAPGCTTDSEPWPCSTIRALDGEA